MAHLIDKDAVFAEIENIRKHYIERDDFDNGWNFALDKVLSFLNSLEVKEVDLEKEIDNYFDNYKLAKKEECWLNLDQAHIFAKHFFELGLNASNPLTWEDMMFIHKCIKDAMNFKLYKMMEGVEGQKEVYEEVLKRFKEQKGEEV